MTEFEASEQWSRKFFRCKHTAQRALTVIFHFVSLRPSFAISRETREEEL